MGGTKFVTMLSVINETFYFSFRTKTHLTAVPDCVVDFAEKVLTEMGEDYDLVIHRLQVK